MAGTVLAWGPTIMAAVSLGCATSRAPLPEDMSASAHEAAARRAEEAADRQRREYAPEGWSVRECGGPVRGERLAPCWAGAVNPTAGHLEEERRLRDLAARHRAASKALRRAEAEACAGLDGDDRDLSPFWRREDIKSVSPLVQRSRPGYGDDPRALGAVVVFGPVPGLTAEWLQAALDCHVARNAAMGYERPEMAFCPLAVPGARAKVKSTGSALTVSIESTDPLAAAEIARRAMGLVSRR